MASQLQHCVDAIADRLRLPVSLTDTDLNSLVFSPHGDELIDDVRRDSLLLRRTAPWVRTWFASHGVGPAADGPVRVDPHPEHPTLGRWVVPIRTDRTSYGLLCVLDPDGRCGDDSLALIADLAGELAELLHSDEADRLDTAQLVHDALCGAANVRTAALAGLRRATELSPDTSVYVVAVAVAGTQQPHRTPRSAGPVPRPRRVGRPLLQCATTDHHAFLAPADIAPQSIADGLRAAAASCCGDPVLGIGEPMPMTGCDRSHDQARAALSVAARLPELGRVVAFADLGALRFLAGASDSALAAGIDPRVRPLLECGDPVLRQTVETYLENGGDTAATARLLTVHRGTLYYRLGKAETLTGLALSSGGDRLATHLSLLADRLLNATGRAGHDGPVRLLVL